MNCKLWIFIFSIFFLVQLNAQDNYFQQDVDYKINVTLNDEKHLISGTIEIQYKNNAPNALEEIYMHLWGNAFKNKTTAFAKQKLRAGNTDFYFAEEEERGYYEDLEFKINGKSAVWELDEEHIDIARIQLNEPLLSGREITISTPFTLKIPESFSRLGHVETSYQMTQWYPKPAVFDQTGWHAMPYLDMGEFYSEYGSFEVSITLPKNYYVAATGILQTESEVENIEKQIAYTQDYLEDSLSSHSEYPESSDEMKTLVYTAENVHDFAWFADKRFLILKDEAELSGGKKIPTYVFFTDTEKSLWKQGAFYVARAVEFYSDRVGEYPYPHATAVQSALSAGAGMEYPMITVIGVSGTPAGLDQVITHEVGHNWFYGILGSNERDFPWMDEGMNSFHDHKYMDIFYEDYDELGGILPGKIKRQLEYSGVEYLYFILANLGKDQAPNTTSNDLTMMNYFLGAYEKPAMAFRYLEHYLGEATFVNAMNDYYEQWKFKHPQPEDVKDSFEKSTGKDLSWLFDGLLLSNKKIDYAVVDFNKTGNQLTINNKGELSSPVNVAFLKEEVKVSEQWFDGFSGTKSVTLEKSDGDMLVLDPGKVTLDMNYADNRYNLEKNRLSGQTPALKMISGLKTSKTNKLFIIPVIGANVTDGFQLGLAGHNYGIPIKKLQYYINPGIGFRSGELIGSAMLRYDIPQNLDGMLKNISISLGGKSYHDYYSTTFDYNLRFSRIVPEIEFELQKKLVSLDKHFIRYRSIILINDFAKIGRETGFEGLGQTTNVIHNAEYELDKKSPIIPINFRLNSEYWNYTNFGGKEQFVKLYARLNAKYAYKKGKFFNVRLFGGFFPYHTEKDRSTASSAGNFSLFYRGENDYTYEKHFIDRFGQNGFFTRQVVTDQGGGFRSSISNAYQIGLSNNYMASVNLSVDLPFGWTNLIPIKPYFDAGIYSAKATSNDPFKQELAYSGGIMIDFQGVLSVHLPLLNSGNIRTTYAGESNNVFQRISFNIDLEKLDPHRLKRWLTY